MSIYNPGPSWVRARSWSPWFRGYVLHNKCAAEVEKARIQREWMKATDPRECARNMAVRIQPQQCRATPPPCETKPYKAPIWPTVLFLILLAIGSIGAFAAVPA